MSLPANAKPISRETLEQTARIIGESSAVAAAQKDAARREAAGAEVAFFQNHGTLFVVEIIGEHT